jgi:IS30 family transposase
MGYQRIAMEEREEIFRLRYEERLFLWEIGQKLHKDKSAISRELKRGTKNKLYNWTLPRCVDTIKRLALS